MPLVPGKLLLVPGKQFDTVLEPGSLFQETR